MPERGDYLEVSSPGQAPVRVALTKARVQIGRSSACELRLSGAFVSRRHARVERGRQQEWRIIDLRSANGTYVNGRRINVAALSNGDVIGVGSHRIVLHARRGHKMLGSTESSLEIVPSDGATIVAERTALTADRVVPASLLSDLHEASRRLSRARDMDALLQELAREFHALLHPVRLAIGREDTSECQWPIVIGPSGEPADGADLPRLLVPRVQALDSSVAISLSELAAREAARAEGPGNAVLFPIKAGNRRFGHVYVEFDPAAPRASDESIQLLSLLCRQTALIWENLALSAARRDADELHREMEAARKIQLRLFPNRLDLDPGLDVAGDNLPALAISGDYYDCQLVEPGKVLFIVADVMGHGLPAALVMAGVQAVFRTGVRAGWGLTDLDRHIHDAVDSSGEGETFVSGVLGLCDVVGNRLTLLSAGHPWPSIWCGDKPIEPEKKACTGLWGVSPVRSPTPAGFPLPCADWSVVAYTDGLPETIDPNGKPYGTERLTRVHHEHRNSGAKGICEGIIDDVLDSSDSSTAQDDDMTLLVLCGVPTA